MQFKNTALLLTALTAGSAMARSHIHERRHQHPARAVGDIVTAVIDGKVETWRNTYAGPTAAPEAPAAGGVQNAAVQNDAVAVSSSTAVPTTTTATTSPTSTTTALPTGFGGQTEGTGSGVTYCGNQGLPYGSNIIQIQKDDLSKYDYTITLDGSALTEDYQAIFWNKCGEDKTMTGFSLGPFNTYSVPAGSIAYVALDTNTQGGFIGIPASQSAPHDSNDNSILGFWGEFDFGSEPNAGWSGFDVSAITAQDAHNTNFPGLLLQGDGQTSSITTNLGTVTNAYTSNEAAIGGIGGNVAPGPLAISATLGYSG